MSIGPWASLRSLCLINFDNGILLPPENARKSYNDPSQAFSVL
jgi:hypothetical protein